MRKKYFLISGLIILLVVGGYFIMQNFLNNGKENIVRDTMELDHDNSKVSLNINNKKITEVIDEIKTFFHPKSKNEIIAFTDKNGNNLYIYKKGEAPKILYEKSGMKGNYFWSKSGKEIYFKEKDESYNVIVKKIDISNQEISEYRDFPPLVSLQNFDSTNKFYYLDNKTLDIKMNNNGQNISITNDGMYYKILPSPNEKYLIAHKGTNAYLFSSEGNLLWEVGKVLITDWHRNSENFIGFLDTSNDGHSINNSDLYIGNINNRELKKVTNTQNKTEINPTFFDSSTILFDDLSNNEISFIKYNIDDFK